MNFFGKKVAIYGAGKSGLAAYGLLLEKGATATIYDDEKKACATNSKSALNLADMIVVSPGVDMKNPLILEAKLDGKPVISELELASLFSCAEEVAITGTNGKTTTTLLIDAILKRAGKSSFALSNVGTPYSAIADKLSLSDVAVIEASSFQLEGCVKFSPNISVILNILPDHISRHGSFHEYAKAKAKICENQCEADAIIFNDDDETVRKIAMSSKAKKIPFSLKRPVQGAYITKGVVMFKNTLVMPASDADMKGVELENLLAAVAVAMEMGVSVFDIAYAAQAFRRPKYRREKVMKIEGVDIYNDSKATNVSATLGAISGTEGNFALIMGGKRGDENFEPLFCALDEKVKMVLASGENAQDIKECATRYKKQVEIFETYEEALRYALSRAKELDVKEILFSPASKSFDKFDNFEKRGEYFNRAAANLNGKNGLACKK